jgi:hypothetical protein
VSPEYILRQDADCLLPTVSSHSGFGFASHNQTRLKYISELTRVLCQSNLVMYPIKKSDLNQGRKATGCRFLQDVARNAIQAQGSPGCDALEE